MYVYLKKAIIKVDAFNLQCLPLRKLNYIDTYDITTVRWTNDDSTFFCQAVQNVALKKCNKDVCRDEYVMHM